MKEVFLSVSLFRQNECSGLNGQEMRASMTAKRQPLAQAEWSSSCIEKAVWDTEKGERVCLTFGYVCWG